MKFRYPSIILALAAPSLVLSWCDSSAEILCTVIDHRPVFRKYKNWDCKQFAKEVDLSPDNDYEGGEVNQNGYPKVDVEYKVKLCNKNKDAGGKIKLKVIDNVAKSVAKIDNEKTVQQFRGKINYGKCRKMNISAKLDTEDREHSSSVTLMGDLENGGGQCDVHDDYKVRFQYTTDCKVESTVNCFMEVTDKDGTQIMGTTPCSEGLYQTSVDDCRDMYVWYEWKICNNGNDDVLINRKKSKYLLNKKRKGRPKKKIPKKDCVSRTKVVQVNTCDFLGSALGIKTTGLAPNFTECKSYDYLKVSTAHAFPSASPTSEPSMSMMPSQRPSVSSKPTVSMNPTSVPTTAPSANPTKEPSSNPSPSPSKSIAPTLEPSLSPSTEPSLWPSDTPTLNPSVSMVPSENPSFGPTVSVMPSCVPSQEPSQSAGPSDEPTGSPSKSLAPSEEPSTSNMPTSDRRESKVLRRRDLKHKSAKSGKSTKSSKNSCNPKY